jgi:hypothetical protein
MCCLVYDAERDDGTTKAGGDWCENAERKETGYRCRQYEGRWKTCRDFVCLWAAGIMPQELDPRRSRAVARGHGDTVVINETQAGAHRRGAFRRWMDSALDRGVAFVVLGQNGGKGKRIAYNRNGPDGPAVIDGWTWEFRTTIPK